MRTPFTLPSYPCSFLRGGKRKRAWYKATFTPCTYGAVLASLIHMDPCLLDEPRGPYLTVPPQLLSQLRMYHRIPYRSGQALLPSHQFGYKRVFKTVETTRGEAKNPCQEQQWLYTPRLQWLMIPTDFLTVELRASSWCADCTC